MHRWAWLYLGDLHHDLGVAGQEALRSKPGVHRADQLLKGFLLCLNLKEKQRGGVRCIVIGKTLPKSGRFEKVSFFEWKSFFFNNGNSLMETVVFLF